MPRRFTTAITAAVLGAVLSAAGCVRDNIVYRDKSPVQPPAAAAKFVGYSDTSSKQTTCGSCHVDQQVTWTQTKHAKAWADLQASGHSDASCNACHSVSQLGNAVTDAAVGYAATKDARYEDVQCENCHGPGLDHVTTPTISNRPLASIMADTGTKIGNGCGECHTGTHDPFVDEWKQSAHGLVPNQSHVTTSTNTTCVTCHVGQSALTKFNVKTAYLEQGKDVTAPTPITCAVCHDPHKPSNTAQLRFSVTSQDPTQNLCMQCHNRDSGPNPTSSYSPMTPETATLLGTAGWWPPNLKLVDSTAILATHGSEGNSRMCATCHVARATITNAAGGFVFQSTGHTFQAIPCADSLGRPTTGECAISKRSFTACAGSGCHATSSVAQSLYVTDSLRIAALETTLSGQIAKVNAATELNYKSTTLTTAKGAKWNLMLAQKPGGWVHNPFLIEALLTASIKQMQIDYGIAPSGNVTLNNILHRPSNLTK